LLSTSFIFLVTDLNRRQMFLRKDAGIGLTSGSLDVFDFYFQNNLQGPVFNNYDVGSALIFGFKGREKVFVDNRPEAYSVSFFQDTYIPMQESALVWQNRLAEYKFNTIIFAHTDSTPWAKQFLTSIPSDNKWALVYFDRYYVVLVNKDEYSASFISDYEIKIADFRYMIRQQAETKSLKGKFALASLAEIYNQPDLAKEIYRQIIFSYPYNSQALFGLGYLYSNSLERSDLLMALDYFYKGLKISSKTPGVYNQIGLIYWNLNDYSKAEEAWRKSLRVNRNDTARDYLQQIQDLRKKGDLP
jgi:tetratricopeptide (TPR) repeat protein